MTATVDRTGDDGVAGPEPSGPDRAQLLVSGLLLVVGVFLIVDALSLTAEFAKVDPVGPKLVPIVVGISMLVCSALLVVATLRGKRGEQDGGEDIDTSTPADWKTVGLLVSLFVLTIVIVDALGWVIAGAILFGGAATILGNRHWIRNLAIGFVLSLASFYAFYVGLGIPLPAGILDGIL